MVDGLMSKWASDPDYMPLAHEAEHVVDLFLGGLRAAQNPRTRRSLRKPARAAGNPGGRRNAR
jgi:hypothetical protein